MEFSLFSPLCFHDPKTKKLSRWSHQKFSRCYTILLELSTQLLAEEDIEFPVSESLEATQLRAYKYWNEVILPQLKSSPTILVVSHENTLRSILMKIENVSPEDIVNLSIPRAMPLLYRLDDNFEPIGRSDNTLDATGFLRAEWLCGDDKVTEILEKERKMVYNTRDSS